MNITRSKIDVKMHRINIKTSKKSSELFELFELFESFELFELSKIHSNLSSTSIN